MTFKGRRLPTALIIGVGLLASLVVIGIVAPLILGSSPDTVGGQLRKGPSAQHWLGTDALGRDVLQRTIAATGITLSSAAAATFIAAFVGIIIGAGCVLAGRLTRKIGARTIDLLVAYPPVILALTVIAILTPSTPTVILAIGIALSPQFARLANTLTVSVDSREFVTIARHVGLGRMAILTRHIVPNVRGPLVVLASVAFASSIVALSGLSFLGLGVQQPSYDWGSLLSAGIRDIYTNPAAALGPGFAILLAGLGAGLIGDSLTDVLRPRAPKGSAKKAATGQPASGSVPLHVVKENADSVVSVRDLHVSVQTHAGEIPLVHGVSFDIPRGQIVGLVGESGSGKSLTAMALARLLSSDFTVQAQELRIGELDLTNQQAQVPKQLAMDLGVVFQDPSSTFNPAVKMGPQLTETLRLHRKVGRNEARDRAVAALTEMRVTEPAQRLAQYPHELSGGLRQRAMIAMSLMTQPKLLIADEPTTALDVTVQAEVLRLMKKACQDHGTSVLLISHDINVVSAMCDTIHVMRKGQIVETVTSANLRARTVSHPYTKSLLAASALLEQKAHIQPSGSPQTKETAS